MLRSIALSPQASIHSTAVIPRPLRGASPRLALAACAILAFISPTGVVAQEFELTRDLWPGTVQDDLSPQRFVTLGGLTFFVGTDGEHGREPWVTDGTSVGTMLLADLAPGPASSDPVQPVVLGGSVYFIATAATGRLGLWQTDLTSAGTTLVVELQRAGAFSGSLYSDGNLLYFGDGPSSSELEPWVSDGTAAGTQLLADLNGAGGSSPDGFVRAGSLVFFQATAPATGAELYATDGTTGGTYLVADVNAGSTGSAPRAFRELGGLLLFSANDGTTGDEPWVSDGTALGTTRLADLQPGAGGSSPVFLGELAGTVLFRANDGTTGLELWKTDGVSVTQVLDIFPGSVGGLLFPFAVVHGSHVYFAADDGVAGIELWRSDGTAGGTGLVADLQPGAGSSVPFVLRSTGGRLYSIANDGTNGRELWATNGAGTSTQLVFDFAAGSPSGVEFLDTAVSASGDLLLQAGQLTVESGSFGAELWATDGTNAGTQRLTDALAPASSSPRALAPWPDGVVFLANPASGQTWLGTSDGTNAGTEHDDFLAPSPGDENSAPSLALWNDLAFVVDRDLVTGQIDLWAWDDALATVVAEDFSAAPSGFRAASSGLVFRWGATLGVTSGAAVGAAANSALVGAAPLCSSFSAFQDFEVVGDLVIYGGLDGGDCQLWVSDLVAGTSTALVDLNPLGPSAGLDFLGTFAGVAFFRVTIDGESELWSSDGTAAGTQTVPIPPLGSLGFVTGAASQTTFYLLTWDVSTGEASLWSSDGSTAGTQLVADAPVDATWTSIRAADTGVFLGGTQGVAGAASNRLWYSDGASAPVLMPDSGCPSGVASCALATAGEHAVVWEVTAARGAELALLHGPTAVLEALPEVQAGSAGSLFGEALVSGARLWVNAFRTVVGFELFVLDLDFRLNGLFGDGFDSGDTAAWSATVP